MLKNPNTMNNNEATVEQMDEAIANFMGHYSIGSSHIGSKWFKYADYHLSWDLLMSVVEKIECIQLNDKNHVVIRAAANVQIFYKACLIQYDPDEESGDTNDAVSIQTKGETKLDAVYNAVYKFIQWYNQQTKP